MFFLETFTLEVKTTAETDILDLTASVAAQVEQIGVAEGLLTLFISGSTAALSTIEFETGVVNGSMTPRALALIQEWRKVHLDELRKEWELVKSRKPLFPIKPLE